MSSDVKLDIKALRELMKSPPIMELLKSEAEKIISEHSGEYKLDYKVYHGQYIDTIVVGTNDVRTYRSKKLPQMLGVPSK